MPEGDLPYPPAQYGAGWLLLVLALATTGCGAKSEEGGTPSAEGGEIQ